MEEEKKGGRKRALCKFLSLTTKTVQRPPLPLQRVNDVHRRHRLPAGVLRVRHRVPEHVLEEDFEDAPRLLVYEAGDALHAPSARQAADGGFRDPLYVVPPVLACGYQ